MTDAAIAVVNLSKRYGPCTAVAGVSFEVARGTIFGLLGPNGAGKTSVLECLVGLRKPDGGTVRLQGKVGVALQGTELQDRMTPREALGLFGAFYPVCCAFLGVGWIIATLADNVPAVQAIGQCVFLPMIMIGGVGVPLRTLPGWAQRVADFLPGRYAVEALDACILPDGGGLGAARFALGALGVIGAAAFAAGGGLFRWEPGPRRMDRAAKGWLAVALGAWVAVGMAAGQTQVRPVAPVVKAARPVAPTEPWQAVTEATVAASSTARGSRNKSTRRTGPLRPGWNTPAGCLNC